MIKKFISRLYPSQFVVFLLLFPFSFLSAQETQPFIFASQSSMIQQYAITAKSEIFHQLVLKDMSQKIDFEKNICDRAMGKNLCPRISKGPFFIKEICRIGKHLNSFRSIHSKCGNVTYRLNENGVSMKFYLTRYYMNQP